MAPLENVPIIDVQNDNIGEVWPTMLLAVRTSTFVALDMELSGLGDRRELNAKEVDTRYTALNNIARTRSVISVGLSCYKQTATNPTSDSGTPATPTTRYLVQTFNILMLCSEDYIVEPLSLRFLVNHKFDFNRQYAKGIHYHRGPDQPKAKDRQWLRELFAEISVRNVPMVFHNAFVDLGFLYQSYHTNLPSKMPIFLADLAELFPGGIYDTKYVTEYQARFPASYLEYVFRKCQRENRKAEAVNLRHFSASTLMYPSSCWYVTYLPCAELPSLNQDAEVCECYAAYGWCARGLQCEQSHDINLILDKDEQAVGKKKNKRRRKRKHEEAPPPPPDTPKENGMDQGEEGEEGAEEALEEEKEVKGNDDTEEKKTAGTDIEMTSDVENSSKPENKTNVSRTEGHRAGFDSFMTGYIFAHFIEKFGKHKDTSSPSEILGGMANFMNKVALGGKDFPLHIVQSTFTKTSKEHKERLGTIRSGT